MATTGDEAVFWDAYDAAAAIVVNGPIASAEDRFELELWDAALADGLDD